jgi:hypothetical protein
MSLVTGLLTVPNRAENKNLRVWAVTITGALRKTFIGTGRLLINFYIEIAEARSQREMIVAERYRDRYLRELGASLRSKISSKLT